MNATMLLGTLKSSGLPNTDTLCTFLADRMKRKEIDCDIITLVEHEILPGTYSDMGEGDEWPAILEKVLHSDIIIVATPIWWSTQSSLTQRVIERLDELHDMVLQGKPSPLEGKVGGIVITGDSDGAEHVIGNLCNFPNAIGVLIPPYATRSVLWDRQAKSAEPTKGELLKKYESDYKKTAGTMIDQLLQHAAK